MLVLAPRKKTHIEGSAIRTFGVCAIVSFLALICCGSSEPEARSLVAEKTERPAEVKSEPRPYRIIDNQIVTDKFDVRYDLRDARLTIALDTDLGDTAIIMVSISRSYWKRGSDDEYPIDYFSEKSTVGAWRDPRTIGLNHDAWKREIEKRQRALASAGEPFIVSRIADNIESSFVVPVNQEPPFKPLNANLSGDVVTQNGDLRIVRREVVVPHQIDATNVGKKNFADPLELARDRTYRTSSDVPLLPEIDPPDPISAIASIRQLRPGEEFTVLEITRHRDTPWYRVSTRLGEGWINSWALIGKDIVVVR